MKTTPKIGDSVRVIGSPENHTVTAVQPGLIGGPHVRMTDCGNPACDCRGLTAVTLLSNQLT